MKAIVPFAFLFILGAVPPPALAQTAGSQDSSRDASRRVLDVGQEVRVRDDTGRSTRGRVVAISHDQLVIGNVVVRRWSNLWNKPRREERAIGVASITRIDTVDSNWNGTWVGAAAGVGVMAFLKKTSLFSDNTGQGVILLGVPVVISTALLGGLIDSLNVRPIYERSPQTPRFLVAPMLGPGAIGVSALVGF